jgi:hypothetical protein
MLVVLFLLLSYASRKENQPAVQVSSIPVYSYNLLDESIYSINTIEYIINMEATGIEDKKIVSKTHYYYRRPDQLRVETKIGDNINIDIFSQDSVIEIFPSSSVAYYREKWKDGSKVFFQLEGKLRDIMLKETYSIYKTDKIRNIDTEIIRSTHEEDGKIYEHKVWIGVLEDYKLPIREEYLCDGNKESVYDYEYISINKQMDDSIFEINQSEDIKVYEADGIPKLVIDIKEAESYAKFDVILPKYIPQGFNINEMYVIPPSKSPSVLISYISKDNGNTIYFNQKNTQRNELKIGENDKIIQVIDREFATRKLYDNSISVRWVRNNIEYEVIAPKHLKEELKKIVQGICGLWINI